jgi:hypothetical protein
MNKLIRDRADWSPLVGCVATGSVGSAMGRGQPPPATVVRVAGHCSSPPGDRPGVIRRARSVRSPSSVGGPANPAASRSLDGAFARRPDPQRIDPEWSRGPGHGRFEDISRLRPHAPGACPGTVTPEVERRGPVALNTRGQGAASRAVQERATHPRPTAGLPLPSPPRRPFRRLNDASFDPLPTH